MRLWRLKFFLVFLFYIPAHNLCVPTLWVCLSTLYPLFLRNVLLTSLCKSSNIYSYRSFLLIYTQVYMYLKLHLPLLFAIFFTNTSIYLCRYVCSNILAVIASICRCCLGRSCDCFNVITFLSTSIASYA